MSGSQRTSRSNMHCKAGCALSAANCWPAVPLVSVYLHFRASDLVVQQSNVLGSVRADFLVVVAADARNAVFCV